MKAQSEDKTVTWIYFRQKRDRSLFETVLDRVHGTDTSLNDYIFPLLIPKNSFLTCPKKIIFNMALAASSIQQPASNRRCRIMAVGRLENLLNQ